MINTGGGMNSMNMSSDGGGQKKNQNMSNYKIVKCKNFDRGNEVLTL
jgi:hypothetical protein